MKYRKKPVVIRAKQFNAEDYEKWCSLRSAEDFVTDMVSGAYSTEEDEFYHQVIKMGDGEYRIETLEGDHFVSEGDFIIKGVEGEFYPCKPDIFKRTYEEVK